MLKKHITINLAFGRSFLLNRIVFATLMLAFIHLNAQRIPNSAEEKKQYPCEEICGYIIKKNNLKKGNYILDTKAKFDHYLLGIFEPLTNKPSEVIDFKKQSVVLLYLGKYNRQDRIDSSLSSEKNGCILNYKVTRGKNNSWIGHNYKLLIIDKKLTKNMKIALSV